MDAARLVQGALRMALGLFFVIFSLGKFTAHDAEVQDFARWGVPQPDLLVPVVGSVELVGGALLISGIFARAAALVLAANMIGAMSTAGRVDGGGFNLVVPPVVAILCLAIAVTGGGAWQLRPWRWPPLPWDGRLAEPAPAEGGRG